VPSKLLADENIPAKAIEALRDAGCDLLSIRETAAGVSDEEVLRIAVAQGRILVTFDRDYGELIFREGREPPPSIIYFRVFPAGPGDVSDAVLSLLADSNTIDGAMVIVSSQGIRRRRFHKAGR
jgi:predicted nuclease of predicted toxin-antitoxin system